MRVKEIKAELSALRISSADAFEKEELVKRLYDAKKGIPKAATDSISKTTVVPVGDTVRSTLYFTSMDYSNRIISAENNDAKIFIEPSDQPYATVQIHVTNPSGIDFNLSLLLDTACSGFVLRPSVVKRYNLPTYSTPVTMTGAGGTAGSTGLTQINQFTFGDMSYGPLPAAVQDIGALPSTLDGIIGLSFLSQFACVEMDFGRGAVTLYKKERKPPIPESRHVVAEAEMFMTNLGIWIVDVTLDGRGPVKMLVDSGAASTFLSWKGVSDLSLSRDSPLIEKLTAPMGAMGSDNIAMALTHRLTVRQNLNLGVRSSQSGLVICDDGIKIDVGEIAVLDAMSATNVGGILGVDVLMRCAVVRMTFNGPVPRVTLIN
jgi:predicted aspartyl protease